MEHIVDTIALKVKMVEAHIDKIIELSEKTGIDRNRLASIINGTKYPSSSDMAKIGYALNFSAEDYGNIFFVQKLA